MPEVSPADMEVLRVWNRCKAFNQLPLAGGVLDQPVWLMDCLSEVDNAVQRVRAKQDEDERSASVKQNLARNLDG